MTKLKKWLGVAVGAYSMAVALSAQAEEVSATGKGIAGGALIGAELTLVTEAIVGVEPEWAYWVGAGAGAAAGGVGGYFLEQNASPQVNMYVLATGMALVIPALIVTLNATAFRPPADELRDRPAPDEPAAEPAAAPAAAPPPGAPAVSPAAPTGAKANNRDSRLARQKRVRNSRYSATLARRAALTLSDTSPALFGLSEGRFKLSLPAVAMAEVFSKEEVSMFGLPQRTSLRMPVFNLVF